MSTDRCGDATAGAAEAATTSGRIVDLRDRRRVGVEIVTTKCLVAGNELVIGVIVDRQLILDGPLLVNRIFELLEFEVVRFVDQLGHRDLSRRLQGLPVQARQGRRTRLGGGNGTVAALRRTTPAGQVQACSQGQLTNRWVVGKKLFVRRPHAY